MRAGAFHQKNPIISEIILFDHIRGSRRRYCPQKVRRWGRSVLNGLKLEAEREFYMELYVQDWDYKTPLYCDVLEGKPFMFTSEESRVRVQIFSFITFLKSGGQLWALENYRAQVEVATGHSASIADFACGPAHISVSVIGFDLLFFK